METAPEDTPETTPETSPSTSPSSPHTSIPSPPPRPGDPIIPFKFRAIGVSIDQTVSIRDRPRRHHIKRSLAHKSLSTIDYLVVTIYDDLFRAPDHPLFAGMSTGAFGFKLPQLENSEVKVHFARILKGDFPWEMLNKMLALKSQEGELTSNDMWDWDWVYGLYRRVKRGEQIVESLSEHVDLTIWVDKKLPGCSNEEEYQRDFLSSVLGWVVAVDHQWGLAMAKEILVAFDRSHLTLASTLLEEHSPLTMFICRTGCVRDANI